MHYELCIPAYTYDQNVCNGDLSRLRIRKEASRRQFQF